MEENSLIGWGDDHRGACCEAEAPPAVLGWIVLGAGGVQAAPTTSPAGDRAPGPAGGAVARLGYVPVVCVVAPAGYGKTTLLAQWAEREPRPVAWVAVDQRDNDPAVLLTYVAVALDRVEPIDPRIVRGLAGPGASIVGVVPRLAAAMAAMTQPVALVLDHLELLGNQACLDVVAELAAQLPRGAQLLLASRARPPLPVGLLRAHGRVVELGVE